MKRKTTNFDVFKKKLMDSLKPETVCSTIMCGACPFRAKDFNGCTECNDKFVAWLREEAK